MRLVAITDVLGYFPTALFSVDLILYLHGSAHWNKKKITSLRQFASCTWQCLRLKFFILLNWFVYFFDIVYILSLNLQIPKTSEFLAYIGIKYEFQNTISNE